MDAFGYTSFLACSRIPEFSFDYGFHSKFQLANNRSALQNNVIFFTGQKGREITCMSSSSQLNTYIGVPPLGLA
ncbi:Protein eyes shut like protein [Myotis davidii]|uniref:Protein eyes shut like protein n=1 Tax=Myotis davidii TaxID=225400 RepID=L5MCD2_MYODS|nr:Protein eyes shut like protein [Myotis davidii]